MPQAPREPIDELATLLARRSESVQTAMLDLARATVKNDNSRGAAFERLRTLMAETMTLSDLLGRRRTILWAEYTRRGVSLAARPQVMAAQLIPPTVPNVPFDEAVEDITSRTPELARNAEAVSDVYRRHGFAVAYSADRELTARIQKAIADALGTGRTVDQSVAAIMREAEDFTRAYAETVYRTNAASAYTAGRVRQGMESPEINEILPAWEFNAVGDADTRENHQAADGLLAAKDDPVWADLLPPIGYNCRCAAREVDAFELEARGLLTLDGKVIRVNPPTLGAAHPDKGFGGVRPDRRFY